MKGDITKIYGVDLVGSENPNALKRTDDADGLTITVGPSEIDSGFDDCYPWSDIEEVTDEFGNVFIKIPKFYSKITKNSDGTYLHQLSGTKYSGFDTLFKIGEQEIDYVMVGKYEGSGTSSRIYSKSRQSPLVSITMDDFRNGCKANGAGYQQYDFLIDLIIKELWLIEMKTTNCQSIMYGYTNSNAAAGLTTGYTDDVKTPSGSPRSNTDGKHACKYRGIENPWGNIFKWCDGISFDNATIYICTEPTVYKAGQTTGFYKKYGTRSTTNGYTQVVTPLMDNSLVQYATGDNAYESSYYCDQLRADYGKGTVLCCGGEWKSGRKAGLWNWDGGIIEVSSYSNVGGRLCYKPPVSRFPSNFNPCRNQLCCAIANSAHTRIAPGMQLFVVNSFAEAFYLQPADWIIDDTGDMSSNGDTKLEYLNYPYPFDNNTGSVLGDYTNIEEPVNTKALRDIGECCLQPQSTIWQPQQWGDLQPENGYNIWVNEGNVYYSSGSTQYQLDKTKSTWSIKDNWKGLTIFDGKNVWFDGATTWYSAGADQYVLTTSDRWGKNTWGTSGYKYVYGLDIWTLGDWYYSHNTDQYRLAYPQTWVKEDWWGSLSSFNGHNVWRDGQNVYYSEGTKQHQFDTTTHRWIEKTWKGLRDFNGANVWTDGQNVYYSEGTKQYQFDKTSDRWIEKQWTGLGDFNGANVWTDGVNYYYSEGTKQYYLKKEAPSQYNVWTDRKRIQIETPAGPRVVQTQEPATWDDTKCWVEGWDKETDTHMVQVKRHPQLTNKTLNIDCYMNNIDDLYTGLDTCTLSYENGADGNSGTWYLKRGDSTYITLKVTQTQKQEGQS